MPAQLVLPSESEAWEGLTNLQRYENVREALELSEQQELKDLGQITWLREHLAWWHAECSREDVYFDLEHNHYLTDKGGAHELFHPYASQKRIIQLWLDAELTGRSLRVLIPKSRRHGISQIIESLIYRRARNNPNQKGLVLAHEDPAAIEIFSKLRYVYENDPYAPPEDRASVREIKFAQPHGSHILVRTAGSTSLGVGRAFGYHLFHASEPAFYPESKSYEVLTAILTTMPHPQVAQTFALLESTGNGQDGMFPEMCLDVLEGGDEYSDWQMVFLPATERHDTERDFIEPWEVEENTAEYNTNLREERRAKLLDSLTEEEKVILEGDYGASPEFLNWRRWTYENEIKAPTPGEKRRLLRQEHPLKLEECFQAAGGAVYDAEQLSILVKKNRLPSPKNIGDIHAKSALWRNHARIPETPLPRFDRVEEGPLLVWERPQPGHDYCIGIDLAEGQLKGDFTAAVVMDRDSKNVVARWRSRVPIVKFVDIARLLSKWYNDALLCPEVNSFPGFVESLRATDRERFLYWRKDPSRVKGKDEYTVLYGWRTTASTKANLVTLMQEFLHERPHCLVDPLLIHEMSIFKEKYNPDTGKTSYPGAIGRGKRSHDDVHDATALAFYCDRDMPRSWMKTKTPTDEEKYEKFRSNADTPISERMKLAEAAARMNTNEAFTENDVLWGD